MKTKFTSEQAKYFDKYSNKFDEKFLNREIPLAENIEFNYLLSHLQNLSTKTILDLGCGSGRVALRLTSYAKKVVGIDISNKSIDIANDYANKNKIKNFIGIVDDFKSDKFLNQFDYIIAINLVHHTDDINSILKNCRKSLKKEGKLIIFEINPLNILFIPYIIFIGQISSHLNKEYLRSNIFSLKKLLINNNFKKLKIYKYAFLPTMLYNYSIKFKKINETLNQIPIINTFCAFHFIECS